MISDGQLEPITSENSQSCQNNREWVVFLRRLLKVQSELDVSFYFVGGCVRDAYFYKHSLDIDIAVDGALTAIEPILSNDVSLTFSAFGTAKLKLGEHHIDLASFRDERYTKNNGLPEILAGDIHSDIRRRDFTINTGYVLLSDESITWFTESEHLGKIRTTFAHPLFETDIQSRTLRILHAHSFEEDASRLLRAVKYMTIHGLTMEMATREAFDKSIASKALEHFSNNRYRQILVNYLDHPKWFEIYTELFEHGLLLHILENAPKDILENIRHIDPKILTLSEWEVKCAFLLALYDDNLDYWIDADRRISKAAKSSNRLVESLLHLKTQSELTKYAVYKVMITAQRECLAYTYTTKRLDQEIKEAVKDFLIYGRHINVCLNGEDLKAQGMQMGKEIGTTLNLLLEYKVNTNQKLSREEEIEWIESYLYEHRHKT